MSFIVKAMIDGKWCVPFEPMSHSDAVQMREWLLKHSKVTEKVRVVPVLKKK